MRWWSGSLSVVIFFFQAEDGIRDYKVTGVQTCALPILLATDAYKQVIGQQNFEMGAVVGFVLLVPAVLAFELDRQIQRKQVALLSARAVPLEPRANAMKDAAFTDRESVG